MATATEAITNTEDYIDTRTVIERIDYLKGNPDDDEAEELALLTALIEELRGNAGDTPEDGVQLIRDSYFEEYAEKLATDIGAINPKAASPWPLNHIDWEAAADELKSDYTTIEFDGVTYWYR